MVTGPTGERGPAGSHGLNGAGYTGDTGPSGRLAHLLPTQGNVWVHLGTLQTRMGGSLTQLEICSQNEFATTDADFVRALLVFSSTDGTVSQQAFDDNSGATSPFYGVARVHIDSSDPLWDNHSFAIYQSAGQGSNVGTFEFFMVTPLNPGRAWLTPTVCPGATFVFSGLVMWQGGPPTPYVSPQLGTYFGPTGPTGAASTGPTGASTTGPTGSAGELRFRLPDPGSDAMWCQLGTWSTNVSDRRLCTLRISSQTIDAGVQRFRSAFLQLSSGDWMTLPSQATDGSNFFASAQLQLTSEWPGATSDFWIEQVGQPTLEPRLEFRVWMRLYGQAGNGHYTATPFTSDAWSHSGTLHPVRPTAQVINPSVVAGPTGAASTGPTGAASTVTGPTGANSSVTGPTGANSTVTGPTGAAAVVYAIPNVANSWIHLGTVSSLAPGTVVHLQVFSNALLGGNVKDELYCTVRFSTSNGTSYVRLGQNGAPFYGEASISQSLNFSQVAAFAVQQNSTTSYSFFFDTGPAPGVGFFTVESRAAFVYSGAAAGPTDCWIYPNLLFEQGMQDGISFFTADAVLANEYGGRSEGPVSFRDLSSGLEVLTLFGPTGAEFYSPVSTRGLRVETGPVSLPNSSLSIANTSGLQSSLDGKANLAGPTTFTGTTTCANLTATGTVTVPDGSFSVAKTSGLQSSLDAKANLVGPTTFTGTVNLPQFQTLNNAQLNGTTNCNATLFANILGATTGFTTSFGTQGPMSAGVSSTIYTLAPNTRGIIVMDTDSTNASSCVAYFSNMSGVNYLSILARNGNAFSAQNIGANFGGTWNMTCVINSSGNIRVSVVNAGSIRWNVVLFSVVV